jgi:membrane associated rhomboid family serine protease
MSPLDKLEGWFGRFAIPHLTLMLVGGQVLVYLVMYAAAGSGEEGPSEIRDHLALVPEKVLEGEWWRLFTFAVTPAFGANVVWAFFGWYFFWMMGSALEAEWGTFRYNVFLLIGYLATVAVAFALPAQSHVATSSVFWLGSVFLAFAYLYPDYVIRLFFILPIPVKWLALMTWLGYGMTAFFAVRAGQWNLLLVILAAVLNFLLFFGRDLLWRVGVRARRREPLPPVKDDRRPQHLCRVCGITDRSHPMMDFRYCSKCEGDCCYCAEHLKTHEHVKAKT